MTTRVRYVVFGTVAAALAATVLVTGRVAPPPAHAAAAPRTARYVLAISVDGLRPAALEQLGPSGAPAYHRLLREGAGTLDARSAVERTTTLPNHTGMLTGRAGARRSRPHPGQGRRRDRAHRGR